MVKLCSVSNMCLAAKDFRIFVTDWFRRDMTCTRLSIVSRLFHQFVHAVRSRGERHHMDRIFEFGSLKTFISFFMICCCYQKEKEKNPSTLLEDKSPCPHIFRRPCSNCACYPPVPTGPHSFELMKLS